MILRNSFRLAVPFFFSLLLFQSIFAQTRIGTVQGIVKDPTGALVPNDKVTITQPVTGYSQTTQTNSQGSFKLVNVPFNTYKVRAEAPDFQPAEQSIDLESTIPANLELSLSLTTATAAVTVTTDTSAVLETDRTSSDTDLNQTLLERPLGAAPSRVIESMVASTPGFVTDDNGRMHPRGSESQVQYVVDGVPVTDNLSAIFSTSLDARTLRTVEVLTGGIPAEFGDKLAGVINVNTRSGLEGPTQGGLSFSGGSFSTGEIAADFSTHTRFGFLTNLSTTTSQRYLDPPTLDNFHNFGRTGKGFFRLDYQFDTNNTLRGVFTFGGSNFQVPNKFQQELVGQDQRQRLRHLLLLTLTGRPILAQEKSPEPLKGINANIAAMPRAQQQTPAPPAKRSITISDAVSIFLQQNLQLVAARYDIDTVDAEKLTARLRPNPQISVGFSDIPLDFSGSFVKPQTFSYGISQTLELGGKRSKRIDAANADSEVARAEFQIVLWQLTNDVKKKFYAVLLAESLLKLAQENQKTFAEIIKHTTEVFQLGEISGLDLQRLEIEKFKFDTDVANSERDYELAVRDLRVTLGGDYRAMDIEVAGTIDYYQPYEFSLAELRDKALAARPDLRAAQLSERAADASIRLQDAQRIPDLTLGAGIEQVPLGTNTYNFGVGITLPMSNRNQGERAKALIQRMKAQNEQQLIANQVLSDVDKALVAFEIQKRRVELYRTGVLTKVDDIQRLTEFSLKAGESSTIELLDAIRTRRETLAGFYQTLFDYQVSLLDLELATATPLQK